MTKASLLIVDDEKDLAEVVGDEFSEHSISLANNGKSALTILMSQKVDLVITDINMPLMDGLTLLAEVKKAKLNIPVILMTAFDDTSKVLRAWELGAYDFLEKPLDFGLLREAVESALESTRDLSSVPKNKQKHLVAKLKREAAREGQSFEQWVQAKLKK